jgi:hypothetical protein
MLKRARNDLLKDMNDKAFLSLFDLGYYGSELENKINLLNNEIYTIDLNLKELQPQIKSADKEEKQQIIQQIKNINNKKKQIQNNIDNYLENLDEVRINLTRRSNESMWDDLQGVSFPDYVINEVQTNSIFKNRFDKLIRENEDYLYKSDYGKRANPKYSRTVLNNLTRLPSFTSRISRPVRNVLQPEGDLTNNITSFLGGEYNKNRSLKNKKHKTLKRKSYKSAIIK